MGAYIGDTTLDFINSYGTDSVKMVIQVLQIKLVQTAK